MEQNLLSHCKFSVFIYLSNARLSQVIALGRVFIRTSLIFIHVTKETYAECALNMRLTCKVHEGHVEAHHSYEAADGQEQKGRRPQKGHVQHSGQCTAYCLWAQLALLRHLLLHVLLGGKSRHRHVVTHRTDLKQGLSLRPTPHTETGGQNTGNGYEMQEVEGNNERKLGKKQERKGGS